MDALYFLKSRTAFIRFFYNTSAKGFVETQDRIKNALPPFDNPPYNEEPEPPFLAEWMDADAALDVLGLACISMLSDTLKLYFSTLEKRVIGFSFEDPKAAFRRGFVAAYFEVLGEILDTDWSDCPVDRALIEQIVLARNRSQHGESLTSFTITHDRATLEKHPRPFFLSDAERLDVYPEGDSFSSLLMPTIEVSPAGLDKAIDEVDALGEWIDGRLSRAHDWRMRGTSTH